MSTGAEIGFGGAAAEEVAAPGGAVGNAGATVARLAGSVAVRDLGRAVVASTAGALAVFLVGALAVQLRGSLHFGPSGLGLAVAVYYVGSGIGAVPFGRLAERIGAPAVMRCAALGAAVVLVLVATCARSLASLLGLLLVAGLVGAAMGPATNLYLAQRVRRERQGVAYGVKQATIPLAATCAGVAVPAIGLSIGWRWAFALAAVLAGLAALSISRGDRSLGQAGTRAPGVPTSRVSRPLAGRPLGVLSVGFTLSLLSVNGLNAFAVTAAVAAGFSKGAAGLLVALGAGVTVAARVAIGFLADRSERSHMGIVLGMILLGILGYGALSVASATHDRWVFGLGAVTAFGAGWGWNGLFNYVIVRSHPEAPARATAITQVGGCAAGVVGPLLFGLLVAHGSFSLAWSVVGAVMLAGCGVLAFGKGLLDQEGRPAGEVTRRVEPA